ncbi:MAG: hypothetical protein SFT81_07730 [Candidatus Caenarcaniphilales bacterium]|nr:hypothetical protein [Candidatus Caenarcaniphilales bacterium]
MSKASFALIVLLCFSAAAQALTGIDENSKCKFEFPAHEVSDLLDLRKEMDKDGTVVFRISVINKCTNESETIRLNSINEWQSQYRVDGYLEMPDGSAKWRQITIKR